MNSFFRKGAEAELIECIFLGEKALCKRRVKKEYRLPALDKKLREERTKNEAKILVEAKKAGVLCPLLLHVDVERKELFMQKIDGNLLRERINLLKKREKRRALFESGRQLALLHNKGIFHGDSTTSNILLSGNKLYYIDFGLSDFSSSAEEFATDLLLFNKSVGKKEFTAFFEGYSSEKKDAKLVLSRMNEIMKRGRYVKRGLPG